jgi:hypothetical protein
VKNLEDSDELDVFKPDDRDIFEDGLPDGSSDGDGLDEPLAVNKEDDEDEFEDPDFIASSDDDLNSESDESDDEESEDKNSGEDEMNEEDEDIEEAFINGKHQNLKDSEFDYEKERLLNKQVKERLSQLGLSPRTLKN